MANIPSPPCSVQDEVLEISIIFLIFRISGLKKRSKADQSFNIAEIITLNVGYSVSLLAVDLKEYSFG